MNNSTELFRPEIDRLGKAKILSPLSGTEFVPDLQRTLIHLTRDITGPGANRPKYAEFETAGPREHLYFEPSKTKCAVVTCGGLCPGTNDVIKAIVEEAHLNYGVRMTLGFRYGLQGFIPDFSHDVLELTPRNVLDISEFGGTLLGASREPQPTEEVVDALQRMNVSALFVIGGDGTMRAAQAISRELTRRGQKLSVIGIPKTIDNDIHFVPRSFGFVTAVDKASEAILSAHVEASGAVGGIGMVRVMGRESGFIAAEASVARRTPDFVLVPEHPFRLEGEGGFLDALEKRIRERGSAVIVVSEGAGQHLCNGGSHRDEAGNLVLGDICGLLRQRIKDHFGNRGVRHSLKFIDPSYIIRSVPAGAYDRYYASSLGRMAVHAAMAGRSGMVVARLQDRYVHLPIDLVAEKRRRMSRRSELWQAVLASTGQRLAAVEP